jgi:hypothetical protein
MRLKYTFSSVIWRVIAAFTTVGGCGQVADDPVSATQPTGVTSHSFAVIELFTSEGCSSCPPADALLSGLLDRARRQKIPIFALAFHVDYWNHLGWVDRFSFPEASLRQKRYAAAFGSDDIYTPQMFVNGNAGFVGSDAKEMDKQLYTAMSRTELVDIALDSDAVVGGKFTLSYRVTGPATGDLLNIALVERNATTAVHLGKNAGRTLTHENVVRSFLSRSLASDQIGQIHLELPPDLEPRNVAVIAYVQNSTSMQIVGAGSLGFLDTHLPH